MPAAPGRSVTRQHRASSRRWRLPHRGLLPDPSSPRPPSGVRASLVINVTSVGHHAAFKGIRLHDLQSEGGYDAMEVDRLVKLANVLFICELAHRHGGHRPDRQRGASRLGAEPFWHGRRQHHRQQAPSDARPSHRGVHDSRSARVRGARTRAFLATTPRRRAGGACRASVGLFEAGLLDMGEDRPQRRGRGGTTTGRE